MYGASGRSDSHQAHFDIGRIFGDESSHTSRHTPRERSRQMLFTLSGPRFAGRRLILQSLSRVQFTPEKSRSLPSTRLPFSTSSVQDSSTLAKMVNDHILTLSCPDKPGIIHAVTGIFARNNLNILDLQQFSDRTSEKFFMRVHFGPAEDTKFLIPTFDELANNIKMDYELRPVAQKPKVLIMVSKIGYCLNDLLFRQKTVSRPCSERGYCTPLDRLMLSCAAKS